MDFVRYIVRVYYICNYIVHYYDMKNNYSKKLMDIIEYSREEAARLQNSYIGPEHLKLKMLDSMILLLVKQLSAYCA